MQGLSTTTTTPPPPVTKVDTLNTVHDAVYKEVVLSEREVSKEEACLGIAAVEATNSLAARNETEKYNSDEEQKKRQVSPEAQIMEQRIKVLQIHESQRQCNVTEPFDLAVEESNNDEGSMEYSISSAVDDSETADGLDWNANVNVATADIETTDTEAQAGRPSALFPDESATDKKVALELNSNASSAIAVVETPALSEPLEDRCEGFSNNYESSVFPAMKTRTMLALQLRTSVP